MYKIMKNISLLLIVLMVLLSCNSKNTDNNKEKENKDTITKIDKPEKKDTVTEKKEDDVKKSPRDDAYVEFPAEKEHSDSLNAWLFEEDVKLLNQAVKDFENIKTATELADFYNNTVPKIQQVIYGALQISNPEVMYAGDDAPVESWKFLRDYMPFIGVELMCSECDAEPLTNIYPFIEKAEETSDSTDDMFFKTLKLIFYEDYYDGDFLWDGGGNSGNWKTMDGCDFCSYSNLGNRQIYQILEALVNVQKATKLFDKRINELKSNAFLHLSDYHYAGTHEDVLAELNDIAKLELTEEGKKEVDDALKFLKEKKNDIQYNCENGNCEYNY